MNDLLKGRKVKVLPVLWGDKDAYGNIERSFGDPESVEDVLVAPGGTSSEIEDGRPFAAAIVYTLYFPKTFTMDLRGARIEIDGEFFDIVGDPCPYPAELTPGTRNLVVEVARHVG